MDGATRSVACITTAAETQIETGEEGERSQSQAPGPAAIQQLRGAHLPPGVSARSRGWRLVCPPERPSYLPQRYQGTQVKPFDCIVIARHVYLARVLHHCSAFTQQEEEGKNCSPRG